MNLIEFFSANFVAYILDSIASARPFSGGWKPVSVSARFLLEKRGRLHLLGGTCLGHSLLSMLLFLLYT